MSKLIGSLLRTKFAIDRATKIRTFNKKCLNPMKSQWSFLKKLIERHKETEFGKKYDFGSILSIREFRERVPIHRYQDLAPYFDKVKQGDKNALFPDSEEIIMFAATSGTTGEPKLIPVTNTSYKIYGQYWDHVWGTLSLEYPPAVDGQALYFPGNAEEGYVGDTPYGAITAKAYAQQNFLIKKFYPYPYQIALVKDYATRYYTIMRIAVEKNISIIPIANPSTIITLFRTAKERAEDIIDDVATGRLRYQDQMPEVLRNQLLKSLRPNPKRARQLNSILQRTGDFLPSDYWGNRQMTIICFASGPLNLYLKQFDHYLKKYLISDFGLLASEACLSFPTSGIEHQKGCCLTLESNFFEFIPEDQMGQPNPDVLTMDQVELGKRYFIIFTNYSGLYRYDIHDLVEITGFKGQVPYIYFCNKGKHFSNITGEKLSEIQITESVKRAQEKTGCHLDEFVVCLHWDEDKPSYTLLKSGKGETNGDKLKSLVNSVEEELMRMNVEYHSKRESLRLGPLTLKVVNGNGYEEYESQKKKSAHNISQYKHVFLVNDHKFEDQFEFTNEIPSSVNPNSIKQ